MNREHRRRRSAPIEGECRICGRYCILTKEHVPPQGSLLIQGKDGQFRPPSIIKVGYPDIYKLKAGEMPKGYAAQGGSAFFTLCSNCNNNIGSWYSNDYIEWCEQGLNVLSTTQGRTKLILPYHIYPLRVLKQIIAMFFSLNGVSLGKEFPELREFILEKNKVTLPEKFRVYAYYNTLAIFRFIGMIYKVNFVSGQKIRMTETSYIPFGYVMTVNSQSPDSRLLDISHFGVYGYDQSDTLMLSIPALPTYSHLPGDYRSKRELESREK
jgi:hypothetical protein